MIRKIVVPVDFSDISRRAAKYAVDELAPQLGAAVVFVTVLEATDLRVAMSAGLHGFETDEDVRRQVAEWVDQQFALLDAQDGSVKAAREIRRGVVEREIVEAITENNADLVVMGSTGIMRRFPIGSKADHVLRHCSVPLLLLRE